MPFTGDLEHLPVVDIIQLIHTTRKSGTFAVRNANGESRIVFNSGYIVDASFAYNRIGIGSVLVKDGIITHDDLKEAAAAKNTSENRITLLSALLKTGKLNHDNALKGLKKLVEMTIVDLMSWTKGTFTFDTEAVETAASEKNMSGADQDVVLDAQMVLMDALRIYDERERDRAHGKKIPSFEALYADVLPEPTAGAPKEQSQITPDVLGLADIDKLEKKIPRPVSELELFDPLEIHRQRIRELLAGFSTAEQDAFVAFLHKSPDRKASNETTAQQAEKAAILFTSDMLLRHALMTICKESRIPVFATDDEKDLERILAQCLSTMRMPFVAIDSPSEVFSIEQVVALRNLLRNKYPAVPLLQFAPLFETMFTLQSYHEGVKAVFPKPDKVSQKETYVQEMIKLLEAFNEYVKGLQSRPDTTDRYVKELKRDIRALREIATPSDAAMVLLAAVADMFERAVTFIVHPTELVGERSVGVNTEKAVGPIHADRLKIPLAARSVFREVIEKGRTFYGESSDEALDSLFSQMGIPASRIIMLLPLICDRKVIALVYGDFGKKEAAPVQLDILEILSYQVGISLEYALFRRQMTKTMQKS